MSDLTPERLARLRANAEAVRQADYGHVGLVSPDVVIELLDEIERLRAVVRDAAKALYPLEVRRQTIAACMASGDPEEIAGWDDALDHMGEELRQVQHSLVDVQGNAVLIGPELEPTTTVTSGDMAVELPGAEPDRVVSLMEALAKSVAAAQEARARHPQPGGTRLDDILPAGFRLVAEFTDCPEES